MSRSPGGVSREGSEETEGQAVRLGQIGSFMESSLVMAQFKIEDGTTLHLKAANLRFLRILRETHSVNGCLNYRICLFADQVTRFSV
jgi:hypothetical protein